MSRRIVSAREQVEMLSPWLRTASFDLHLHPSELQQYANPDNGFKRFTFPKFKQTVSSEGIREPVEVSTDGQYAYLTDGHHRVRAADELGLDQVPVRVIHRDGFQPGDPEVGESLRAWLDESHRTAPRTAAARPLPQHGVNINDDHQDYTGQILSGDKVIETRNTNSLRTHIGNRLGIIRTGLGKAHVVGYATIGEPKLYTSAEDFDADYRLHRVAPDSKHHFNNSKYGQKYGYPLHDVEHEPDPYPVDSTGIVTRSISRQAERADRFEWERSFDGGGGWILVTRTPDGNPVVVGTRPASGQRSSALTRGMQ